ncbi:MAG: DUF6324 family protein [Pseudomonadota bacterium]
MTDGLRDDEAGALQVGPTDTGMVRFIIQLPTGLAELDFEPEEAEDIADELMAAAERARAAGRGRTPEKKPKPRR